MPPLIAGELIAPQLLEYQLDRWRPEQRAWLLEQLAAGTLEETTRTRALGVLLRPGLDVVSGRRSTGPFTLRFRASAPEINAWPPNAGLVVVLEKLTIGGATLLRPAAESLTLETPIDVGPLAELEFVRDGSAPPFVELKGRLYVVKIDPDAPKSSSPAAAPSTQPANVLHELPFSVAQWPDW